MAETSQYEPKKKNSGTFVVVALVIIGLLLGGLFFLGFIPRVAQTADLAKAHKETVDAVPEVIVVTARPASNKEHLVLPGNIGAIQYTTIYARIDGYLKTRLVDIGDYVKQGQLLAEIDTPTVDEQVMQGRADLAQANATLEKDKSSLQEAMAKQDTAAAEIVRAKANNNFADVTANRWKNMAVRGAVSLQSRDEKVRSYESTSADVDVANANFKAAQDQVSVARSQVDVAKANVLAKDANLQKLLAEQNFKKVVAPFDGYITLRKVDPGALITQGSQTSSLELFQMAKIDTVRIYVNAPQRVARYLRSGLDALVNVPEYPEKKFIGKVTNVSNGLDPNTRTRQTEIRIANPQHQLLPGMYAEVTMTDLRESPWIRVPGTTIVTKNDGLYVVIVQNGKAHYQKVDEGRDFGDEVEIRTGLQGGEKIVVSPSDDLLEGDAVAIGKEAPSDETNKKS
jgi:multidrug efflux system membrane fusion protein